MRGDDVRKILNIVESGDILLRRFDQYLNTMFTPGFWGHAGVYVGENQVVHSVSAGCIEEDVLNFCRADAVCVLKVIRRAGVPAAIERAKAIAEMGVPYDYDFAGDNRTYYCTELVDTVFNGLFYDDYIKKLGNYILMPDGIYKSDKAKLKLQINYRETKS